MSVTGEVQDLANKVLDSAQELSNIAYDLGEEAARDALRAVAVANKLLGDVIEKLTAASVGK